MYNYNTIALEAMAQVISLQLFTMNSNIIRVLCPQMMAKRIAGSAER